MAVETADMQSKGRRRDAVHSSITRKKMTGKWHAAHCSCEWSLTGARNGFQYPELKENYIGISYETRNSRQLMYLFIASWAIPIINVLLHTKKEKSLNVAKCTKIIAVVTSIRQRESDLCVKCIIFSLYRLVALFVCRLTRYSKKLWMDFRNENRNNRLDYGVIALRSSTCNMRNSATSLFFSLGVSNIKPAFLMMNLISI